MQCLNVLIVTTTLVTEVRILSTTATTELWQRERYFDDSKLAGLMPRSQRTFTFLVTDEHD